jgi:hypothetical protein
MVTTVEVLNPSSAEVSAAFVEFAAETMDLDAALTSCVKFAGPLGCAVGGLISCLVDHWRRC